LRNVDAEKQARAHCRQGAAVKTKREQILDLMRGNPNGMTTAQVAEHIGWPLKITSSHVSKLSAFGFIEIARWTPGVDGHPARVWRACPVQPMPVRRQARGPLAQRIAALGSPAKDEAAE
jgi:predicted ArsR family transcriptional regulator